MHSESDYQFVRHNHHLLYSLTIDDRETIEKQRSKVVHSLSWQDCFNKKYHKDNAHQEMNELSSVCLWTGDYTSGRYYADLDHATTRYMLGSCYGKSDRDHTHGINSKGDSLSEYGCAVVSLCSPHVIEMVRLYAHHDIAFIFINGKKEVEIVSNDPHMPYLFSELYRGTYSVWHAGEVYGMISVETQLLRFSMVLERKDGFRMQIPLRFGASNDQVLTSLISLLTLKFIWSKERPENRNRIIDPDISIFLNKRECIMYFAISLYFSVSIYGERLLGGSGG